MSKTIIVGGYGPGISSAVAERFGNEGFTVALVARNEAKLLAGVQQLKAKGITAGAFPADLSDPAAIAKLVADVRSKLGPITVLHWNAYGRGAGDFLSAKPDEIRSLLDIPVIGLVAALQAALPDLRSQKDAALLVTNGGLGLYDRAEPHRRQVLELVPPALRAERLHRLTQCSRARRSCERRAGTHQPQRWRNIAQTIAYTTSWTFSSSLARGPATFSTWM